MLLEEEIEDQRLAFLEKKKQNKTITENEQIVVIFSRFLISKVYSPVMKFSIV